MNLYEVRPFTTNYGEVINELYQIFFDEKGAYEYANRFKYVEITTINL